jgi:hypothetical protein
MGGRVVTLCVYPRRPILAARPRSFYNFHTRRPRIAHANAHTPSAYTPNTHIARRSEAYIVRIDRFTTPVATFACGAVPNPHPRKRSRIVINQLVYTCGQETKRTRRKTANEFRLTASSKGGAGIGLGPGIVGGVQAESETSETLSLPLPLLGRRTTLRPETGEYVLLESGVGKKARSKSK